MTRKLLSLLCLSTLLASGCATHQTAPQTFNYQVDLASVGATPEGVAAFDSLLQSFIDGEQLPFMTAFVARGGQVVYEKSLGLKNIEKQIPARTDDIYVLFSQTKAVVAVALMTLYEKGLLDVDDPISKWIPRFSQEVLVEDKDGGFYTVPAGRPVTIADLLSHTSGFLAPLTNKYIHQLSEQGQDTRAPRTTVKEYVEFCLRYPLGFQPGTDFNYNHDMEVIAYLAEIISGKPLPQFLKETVLDPLGMDSTAYFYDDESLRPRFVTPYSKVDGKYIPAAIGGADAALNGPKTYAGGTSGLYGPIEDYAKFCQMLLNGGEFNHHRILRPETILMMRQNRVPDENCICKGFQFGLGFELFRDNGPRKDAKAVSDEAFRWGGGAGTEYIIDPEYDLVILYYINMWGKPDLYGKYLDGAYGIFGLK